MSFTWKDSAATISAVVVVGFTLALMLGAFENIEARWALGTFAVFLLAGLTGLITGTAKMMERPWSTLGLYILSLAALTITIVNAFLNSELWFVAMAIIVVLTWLEFITIDLFGRSSTGSTHLPAGGAV